MRHRREWNEGLGLRSNLVATKEAKSFAQILLHGNTLGHLRLPRHASDESVATVAGAWLDSLSVRCLSSYLFFSTIEGDHSQTVARVRRADCRWCAAASFLPGKRVGGASEIELLWVGNKWLAEPCTGSEWSPADAGSAGIQSWRPLVNACRQWEPNRSDTGPRAHRLSPGDDDSGRA